MGAVCRRRPRLLSVTIRCINGAMAKVQRRRKRKLTARELRHVQQVEERAARVDHLRGVRLGKWERRVLIHARQSFWSTLTGDRWQPHMGEDLTRSERECVRRAIRKLRGIGLVNVGPELLWGDGRRGRPPNEVNLTKLGKGVCGTFWMELLEGEPIRWTTEALGSVARLNR